MKIRNRYFCCWNQIQISIFYLKLIFFRLRELSCTEKRIIICQKWWKYFSITVLCMRIQKEIYYTAFQFCA